MYLETLSGWLNMHFAYIETHVTILTPFFRLLTFNLTVLLVKTVPSVCFLYVQCFLAFLSQKSIITFIHFHCVLFWLSLSTHSFQFMTHSHTNIYVAPTLLILNSIPIVVFNFLFWKCQTSCWSFNFHIPPHTVSFNWVPTF